MFWLDTGQEAELEELLEDGPVLLFFYLFDWSPTSWKESLGIDVPLLSDWNGTLARQFGASQVWRWMEGVPLRSAFLVGEGGTVLGSWRYQDGELPDFDELLAAARALSP